MEKIKAIMILEVLGRPADYVSKSLTELLENIKKEQNVKIASSRSAEPKLLDGKNLFSAFVEIELEAGNALVLTDLIFRYMPSHIEVISPDKIDVQNAELNGMLNSLIMKLHRYDELAKILSIERGILARQLVQMKQKLGKDEGESKEKSKTEDKPETKEKNKETETKPEKKGKLKD